MAKLVVLYPPPADTEEFDRAYQDEHVPLMRKTMKGTKVAVASVKSAAAGDPPYYLLVEIGGPSIDDLQDFLGSPAGQEVAQHAFKISTGGPPDVLFAEEAVHEF